MGFLKSTSARVLAVFLLLQATAYYAVALRAERTPAVAPLSVFPTHFNEWSMERDMPLEKEVQDILKADDTLNRIYVNPSRTAASLFVAFFKTQRYGQSPHSPKNCMPGAGWQPVADTKVPVSVPGRETPIVINQYVIARGNDQSFVLYWYQSHNRIVAGELAAKFWLVSDAIRYHRSDTALVRVIVPVGEQGVEAAGNTAYGFVKSVFPELARQLPQ